MVGTAYRTVLARARMRFVLQYTSSTICICTLTMIFRCSSYSSEHILFVFVFFTLFSFKKIIKSSATVNYYYIERLYFLINSVVKRNV